MSHQYFETRMLVWPQTYYLLHEVKSFLRSSEVDVLQEHTCIASTELSLIFPWKKKYEVSDIVVFSTSSRLHAVLPDLFIESDTVFN